MRVICVTFLVSLVADRVSCLKHVVLMGQQTSPKQMATFSEHLVSSYLLYKPVLRDQPVSVFQLLSFHSVYPPSLTASSFRHGWLKSCLHRTVPTILTTPTFCSSGNVAPVTSPRPVAPIQPTRLSCCLMLLGFLNINPKHNLREIRLW